MKKEQAEIAISRTQPDSHLSSLAIKMRSMVIGNEDPGWLVEAGYWSDKDPEKARENRKAVVLEFIDQEALQEALSDGDRINKLFPPEKPAVKRSRLPLSIGSSGFDARQDFAIKGYLPANSLCSIYGPSGSYKSFLAVSWPVTLLQAGHGQADVL